MGYSERRLDQSLNYRETPEGQDNGILLEGPLESDESSHSSRLPYTSTAELDRPADRVSNTMRTNTPIACG